MLEMQKNKINKSQDMDPPTQHTFRKLFIVDEAFISQYQVDEEESWVEGSITPLPALLLAAA